MGRLEHRLRRLEESLVLVPSADEYLNAQNREQVRSLHVLAERLAKLLAPYGFDGDYVFTEETLSMLATDTLEKQAKDQEIIEAWYKMQGRDWAAEVEGAKEKLEALLHKRGGS